MLTNHSYCGVFNRNRSGLSTCCRLFLVKRNTFTRSWLLSHGCCAGIINGRFPGQEPLRCGANFLDRDRRPAVHGSVRCLSVAIAAREVPFSGCFVCRPRPAVCLSEFRNLLVGKTVALCS